MSASVSRKRKERDGAGGSAEPTSAPPAQPSRLLAGYLAHEYLTRGTLLGRRWDQDRTRPEPEPVEAYADVALLLKADGAHVPGIVNPTQLGRWIAGPREATRGML